MTTLALHLRLPLLLFFIMMGCLVAPLASEQASNSPATEHDATPLAERINRVIAKVQERQLRSDEHTPWTIMHAAIAFKADATGKGCRGCGK